MDSKEAPSCSGSSKLSEQDSNLVSQAKEEFDKAAYDECLQTLSRLEKSMENNHRIRHNKAIVEFYKSGFRNHDELLSKLENLALDETNKTKAITFNTKDISLSPIAIYNIAVINYYKQKAHTAIGTLSPLIDKLFDLDESTSTIVGILMVNLLLETKQVNRAQGLLDLLQTQFGLRNERFSAEESAKQSVAADQTFNQRLKFLSMLTQVLNSKIVSVPEDGSLEEAALKAHQYYLTKDFQMASKQLLKISGSKYSLDSCMDLNTCIANNMGIIHLRVRHYAIAAKFFQNAINFDRRIAVNLKEAPLHQLGSVRARDILYNLGISMLHLKRPKEAFKCFLVPIKTYHSNPRLWLRLAEACIMHYEMTCIAAGKNPNMPAGLCSGKDKNNIRKPRIKLNQNGLPTATSEPSLEFAVLCLRSSLTLVTFYKNQMATLSNQSTERTGQGWKNLKDSNFCNPSMPISSESFNVMLASIYASYSYVSLRIGDYLTAYELAQELLGIEALSDAYRMLARMYIGEALVMMERLDDARRYFDPSLVTSLNAYEFETKNWNVKSLDAAQAIVRYNLVVVMLMQGEYEAAAQMLRTCIHPIVASKALDLKMYLETTLRNS